MFPSLHHIDSVEKYLITDINSAEIDMAYDLITREVNCKAAFQNICNYLKLSDITLKDTGEHNQKWFNKFILKNFQEILMWYFIMGFCPFLVEYELVDTSNDKEWMEKYKKDYDKTKTPYKVSKPVFVIPGRKGFIARLFVHRKKHKKHVVCEDANNTFGAKHEKKFGVFTSKGYFKLPREEDGLLQSPLSALFEPYRDYLKYRGLAMQASFTLANPVTFVQNKDTNKDDNIAKVTHHAMFRDAELFEHREKDGKDVRYLIIDGRRKSQQQATNLYRSQTREKMQLGYNYYNTSIIASAENVQPLIGTADVIYPIDDGYEISKANPQPAKIPEEMKEIRVAWPGTVAKAFNVPEILISNVKTTGGGKNSYADIELKTLNSMIHNLTAEMNYLFELVETELKLESNTLELHPQPFYDPEFLLELWDKQRLTEYQMDMMLENSFGIPRDPVKVPSHSTASMDDIIAMKNKEGGLSTQTVKKQMRLLHNADI